MKSRVRNEDFDAGLRFRRGRPIWVFAVWQVVKLFFFTTTFPWPSGLKVLLLKCFGAKIGRGVCLKPRINVHFPWKLKVGDHVWIGEDVYILNFEPIFIDSNACISQRAFLCAGNHDFRDPVMSYRNRPISIGPGAWIGAQVFVAPGVDVGVDAVVAAGSVLTRNAKEGLIYAGNPAREIGIRWKDA